MIVIYDKETRRVLVTETNKVWTLPCNLDVLECSSEADVLVEKNGDVFLKAEALSNRIN